MDYIGVRGKNFVSFVQNIVSNNKISHAYIIELYDYDTDMDLINRFIKLLLCKNGIKDVDNVNCGACNICSLVDSHNYPDIRYIEPNGKEIKKNQLLELQKDFNNKSLLENKRIYVIKEAEKLNTSAANTLLKFLEEPADDIIAILLTNNRYKLLDTILSRCQVLTVGAEVTELDYSNEVNDVLTYIVKGECLFVSYGVLFNYMPEKLTAMAYFKKIEDILITFLRDGTSSYECLYKVNKKTIVKILSILEEELPKLEFNVNYKLWLDSLFSKMIGGVYFV